MRPGSPPLCRRCRPPRGLSERAMRPRSPPLHRHYLVPRFTSRTNDSPYPLQPTPLRSRRNHRERALFQSISQRTHQSPYRQRGREQWSGAPTHGLRAGARVAARAVLPQHADGAHAGQEPRVSSHGRAPRRWCLVQEDVCGYRRRRQQQSP
jgi:hypothetical protein